MTIIPQIGDFLFVEKDTFFEYPNCLFAIVDCIENDLEVSQIKIRPVNKKYGAIWVNYDPTIYSIICNEQTKNFLQCLYGRI